VAVFLPTWGIRKTPFSSLEGMESVALPLSFSFFSREKAHLPLLETGQAPFFLWAQRIEDFFSFSLDE